MRLLPSVLMLGVAAAVAASPVIGQKPDNQIAPRSAELLKEGEAHLAAGRFMEADDVLETALAVDPSDATGKTVFVGTAAGGVITVSGYAQRRRAQ